MGLNLGQPNYLKDSAAIAGGVALGAGAFLGAGEVIGDNLETNQDKLQEIQKNAGGQASINFNSAKPLETNITYTQNDGSTSNYSARELADSTREKIINDEKIKILDSNKMNLVGAGAGIGAGAAGIGVISNRFGNKR